MARDDFGNVSMELDAAAISIACEPIAEVLSTTNTRLADGTISLTVRAHSVGAFRVSVFLHHLCLVTATVHVYAGPLSVRHVAVKSQPFWVTAGVASVVVLQARPFLCPLCASGLHPSLLPAPPAPVYAGPLSVRHVAVKSQPFWVTAGVASVVVLQARPFLCPLCASGLHQHPFTLPHCYAAPSASLCVLVRAQLHPRPQHNLYACYKPIARTHFT
jgi:hypothetical protein